MSFTATATDSDAGQTLTYSLVPAFPAGASIDATSGLFHWTPAAVQAPSTSVITVKVADNGTPSLSDSKTLTVVVVLPPVTVITHGAGGVSLTFPTITGRSYEVQYKDSLNAGPWTTLGTSFTATESTKTISDNMGALSQRFYRIVVLD